jgi:arylsulfatase A-like enzyme
MKGRWKLVSEAWQVPVALDSIEVLPLSFWELYDIEKDRCELDDLAEQYPETVKEMASEWQDWATRVTAVPKPPQKLRIGNRVKKELQERLTATK